MKSIKLEDMMKGEIYTAHFLFHDKPSYLIFRYDNAIGEKNHCIDANKDYSYSYCCGTKSEFHEATEEDKQWLTDCITACCKVPKREVSYEIY